MVLLIWNNKNSCCFIGITLLENILFKPFLCQKGAQFYLGLSIFCGSSRTKEAKRGNTFSSSQLSTLVEKYLANSITKSH